MKAKEVKGMPIVNIVRTEIVTEELEPKAFAFDTASEAGIEPKISAGEEKLLRVKNKILASNNTEDIVTGYELNLKDSTLNAETMCLVDGGTLIKNELGEIIGYEGAESGKVVNRTAFTLNVYTEEKDADGETIKYIKFSYKHCKGKPVGFSLKDGEFFVPELKATSRPKTGEKPVKIEFLDELPLLEGEEEKPQGIIVNKEIDTDQE